MCYNEDMRTINEDIVKLVSFEPCLCCGYVTGATPHHIKTRGSGGGDTIDNLMPLCQKHHTEVGTIGLIAFSAKYVRVYLWLMEHEWEIDTFLNKWRNYQRPIT
jgi:hypothetical protein